jgi:hypothetical protein
MTRGEMMERMSAIELLGWRHYYTFMAQKNQPPKTIR